MHVGDMKVKVLQGASAAGRVASHALPRLAESVKSLATNLMARMGSADSYRAMGAKERDGNVENYDVHNKRYFEPPPRGVSYANRLINTALRALSESDTQTLPEYPKPRGTIENIANSSSSETEPLLGLAADQSKSNFEKTLSTLVSPKNVDRVLGEMQIIAGEIHDSAIYANSPTAKQAIEKTESALKDLYGLERLVLAIEEEISDRSSPPNNDYKEVQLRDFNSLQGKINDYQQQLLSRLDALNSKHKKNIDTLNKSVWELSELIENFEPLVKTSDTDAVEEKFAELLDAVVSYNAPNSSSQTKPEYSRVETLANSLFEQLCEKTSGKELEVLQQTADEFHRTMTSIKR